jgi:hypothetical protein
MTLPPHPVLLNTWKHHAGWLRWQIGEAVRSGTAGLELLARELVVVGTRLMDLYTGPLTPLEIGEQVIAHLEATGHIEFSSLNTRVQEGGGYCLLELADHSRWTIRLGPEAGRYLHLHPGRRATNTIRAQANTLKSAVMACAMARFIGGSALDLATVNEAREKYLGLLPVRTVTAEEGLGQVISRLG